MLVKIPLVIVINSTVVLRFSLPLSVQVQQQVHGGFGRGAPTNDESAPSMSASEFAEKVAIGYAEEQKKRSEEKLPDFPKSGNRCVLRGAVEYDDDDNIYPLLHQIGQQAQHNGAAQLIPFTLRAKDDQDVDNGLSPYDSYKVLVGSVTEETSEFCVLHVQPSDKRLVAFRAVSQIVQILRNSVLANDQRLFNQQNHHYNQVQAVVGVNAFPIKFRVSELLMHAQKIISLYSALKKYIDNPDGVDLDQDDSSDEEEEYDPNAAARGGFGGRGNMAQMAQMAAQRTNTMEEFGQLVEYLRVESAAQCATWAEILDQGKASFDSLGMLLKAGTDVVVSDNEDHLQGARVTSCTFVRTQVLAYWTVTVQTAYCDGQHFTPQQASITITDFSPKLKTFDELPIRPINEEERRFLTERGKVYRSVAFGSHHLELAGSMRVGLRNLRADGRVMVDIATWLRYQGGSRNGFGGRQQQQQQTNAFQDIQQAQQQELAQLQQQGKSKKQRDSFSPLSDSLLFMTPPSIQAFSFRLHTWGRAYIVQLSKIDYNKEAFERLVLPLHQKNMIRACIENTRSRSEVDILNIERWQANQLIDLDDSGNPNAPKVQRKSRKRRQDDFIEGKGGGVVLLLAGPPGTGKTLTAEAVAEVLERPLYSVTTGELGTTADQLEKKLREVLDLAATWQSVILLDEADVFLAQRDDDVVRSGLVSIFLRVLEYHQGVVLLTTNRPETIDEAFASRINISLEYQPLDASARETIWRNFLEKKAPAGAAVDTDDEDGEDDLDFAKLASFELNGRQIRSVCRMAGALARDKQQKIDQQTLELTIKYAGTRATNANKKKKIMKNGE